MNNPFQPRFVHHCSKCVFMGQTGKYDMYFCPSEMDGKLGGSVIAREGDDDRYASSPVALALTLDEYVPERGLGSATAAYIKLARHLVRESYVTIEINQTQVEKRRNNDD